MLLCHDVGQDWSSRAGHHSERSTQWPLSSTRGTEAAKGTSGHFTETTFRSVAAEGAGDGLCNAGFSRVLENLENYYSVFQSVRNNDKFSGKLDFVIKCFSPPVLLFCGVNVGDTWLSGLCL